MAAKLTAFVMEPASPAPRRSSDVAESKSSGVLGFRVEGYRVIGFRV